MAASPCPDPANGQLEQGVVQGGWRERTVESREGDGMETQLPATTVAGVAFTMGQGVACRQHLVGGSPKSGTLSNSPPRTADLWATIPGNASRTERAAASP